MNLYIYETPDNAVVTDYGVMFADPGLYGVDSVYPDITYLKSIKDKLTAFIFTHGHEDHIGGIINAVTVFNAPIYTGKFTADLLEYKLSNSMLKPEIHVIEENKFYKAGDIAISFFPVAHSIPDTYGVVLEYNGFRALHLSDFRIKNDDYTFIEKMGAQGIHCLLLDSTNAASKKKNLNEEDVYRELEEIFEETEGRIFLTTFASNVQRLASAIEIGIKKGRKIILEGAAMERTIGIAARNGLINLPEKALLSSRQAHKEAPSTLLYLVSGCQGEYTSALYSIAIGERKAVKMEKGDLLIFSSRNIPGNEGDINLMINSAMRRGVKVIEASDRLVHVSGHASAPDLVNVIQKINPDYFIPIHGEYRHLAANVQNALTAGIPKENCIIMESGQQCVFKNFKYSGTGEVPAGRIYIDNRGGFVMDAADLSLRKQVSRDGVVVILSGKMIRVHTYGFTLSAAQRHSLEEEIENRSTTDEITDSELIKKTVKRFFKKRLDRRPLIDVIEVES